MDIYRDWSDGALDERRRAIIAEQIKQLVAQYRNGGGDPVNLTLEEV